jgi:hypothetical protein
VPVSATDLFLAPRLDVWRAWQGASVLVVNQMLTSSPAGVLQPLEWKEQWAHGTSSDVLAGLFAFERFVAVANTQGGPKSVVFFIHFFVFLF